MLSWPSKHHLAVKEYGVDWSRRFPDDPLVRADFAVVSGGVRLQDQAHANGIAQVTVAGGQSSAQNVMLGKPANVAVVSCVIETASGRIDAAEITMEII